MREKKRERFATAAALLILAIGVIAWQASAIGAAGPAPNITKLRLLGLIKPSQVKKGLHVCFFGDGTTNTYVVANNSGAAQAAKMLGVKLTTYLSDWDGSRQLNQIQNAISQKSCDGMTVESTDPNVVCRALTVDAKKAKIPVAVANVPICGSKDWTPGMITFSGAQTLDYYIHFINWAYSVVNGVGGGEVASVQGPCNWSGTIPPHGVKAAYKVVAPKYPKVKLVQEICGDFTVEAGLNAGNTILQTHPKIKAIITEYDQNALGVLKALQAKGYKPGQVLVWGLGYDHSAKENINNGSQFGSILTEPVEETGQGVEALIAYLSGKRQCPAAPNKEAIAKTKPGTFKCIPKFIWQLRDPTLKDQSGEVTKKNIHLFTPEW